MNGKSIVLPHCSLTGFPSAVCSMNSEPSSSGLHLLLLGHKKEEPGCLGIILRHRSEVGMGGGGVAMHLTLLPESRTAAYSVSNRCGTSTRH